MFFSLEQKVIERSLNEVKAVNTLFHEYGSPRKVVLIGLSVFGLIAFLIFGAVSFLIGYTTKDEPGRVRHIYLCLIIFFSILSAGFLGFSVAALFIIGSQSDTQIKEKLSFVEETLKILLVNP